MKKLSIDDFIKKSISIHGNKYDYSLIGGFDNNKSKVKIICSEHGIFEQIIKNHLSGYGCPSCSKVKKISLDEFIERANKVHKNKYDYSLVVFRNNRSKIKIICPVHGIFEQVLTKHLSGSGCPRCSGNIRLNTEHFIKAAKEVHGDKYDYSLVEYINFDTKVRIICFEHGIFEQSPSKHVVLKRGCPKCNGGSRKTKEYFIDQSRKVHGDKYIYDLVEYKNSNTHVYIKCLVHGIFSQRPKNHLNGSGCPYCKQSKGEKLIEKHLIERNIKYVKQKTFELCRDKKPLPFDFYLPDYDICIEHDGEQHYKQIKYFGGEKFFDLIKRHDQIKNDFCKNNNIKLVRISYKDNIDERLKDFLNTINCET